MFTSKDIANIILHVMLIASFIIVFFFTYGAYLEKQVVKQQMEYIVDDLVGDLKIVAPEMAKGLKMSLANKENPDLREEDKKAEEKNSELRRNSFIVMGVGIAIGSGIIYYLSNKYNFSVKELILPNVVALVAVGIAYFMFSTYFIAYYKSADPNFVKKAFIESLKKQPEENPMTVSEQELF